MSAAPPPMLIGLDTAPLVAYLASITSDFSKQMTVVRDELASTRNTNAQLQQVVADMKSVAKTNEALLMQATSQNVSRVQFQQVVDRLSGRVHQLESAFGITPSAGSEVGGGIIKSSSSTTLAPSPSSSSSVSGGKQIGGLGGSGAAGASHTTGSGGGGSDSLVTRLSQLCKDEIAKWFEGSGVAEQLRSTSLTAQSTREYLDSLQSKFDMLGPMMTTVAQVSQTIEDRVSLTYFNSSFSQLQQDLQRARDDHVSLKRTVAAHSNEMNEIGVRLQDVLFRASEFTNKRIGLVYDTLCIEENVSELDVEMPEPISIVGATPVPAGSGVSTPGGSMRGMPPASMNPTPTQEESPLPQAVNEVNQAQTRSGSSISARPPPATGAPGVGKSFGASVRLAESTRGESTRPLSKKQSQARLPLDADEVAAKGASLLQTPMFITFRQAILSDIADRVHSTYNSQSSDFGSEVLALRADIRQRVTAQRVVELIKQHQDLETPIRVDQLGKRVDAVEQTLVTQDFFSEALRTKTDVKLSDLKAEKTELEQVNQAIQTQIAALRETVDALDAEREDLRAVAHELDAQVKRDAALKRLFPDGIRQNASRTGGHLDDPHGVGDSYSSSHHQRGPVQPFLPAIVKLVPVEESAVSKYLPLHNEVTAAGGSGVATAADPRQQTASRASKASRLSSRATAANTTGTPAAVGIGGHQPHAPQVTTGNQTPVSRHNATALASSSGIPKPAPRTDNQEAYAKLVQSPEKAGDAMSERAKAKSHPPIPYELTKPS